jgi:hypothetical protein
MLQAATDLCNFSASRGKDLSARLPTRRKRKVPEMKVEEQVSDQRMDRSYVETLARQWVDSIARQGRLLIDMRAKQSEDRQLDRQSRQDAEGWMRAQEHFFVIALGKALDWLKEVEVVDPELRSLIAEFRSRVPEGRDVRNMREHDNAYLHGKGRRQDVFHKQVEGYAGLNVTISADATATVIVEEHYLIGGRLNVRETVEAADQLLQFITEYHELTRRQRINEAPNPGLNRTDTALSRGTTG